MAQLVDRTVAGESRWQVQWKPTREAPGRSQTFASPAVSRGKSQARRDAERLKAYVELHGNACTIEDALVALGYLDVIASSAEPLTVAEWAERWVATRTGIAPRTQHAYQVTLERHVLPKLGDLQLARLSRSDVEAWVASLQSTMAPKTLLNAHGVLSSMLESATRETPPLRRDNPARGIRLRRGGTTDAEMCFLTHAEWALLYGCLERVSTAGREVDSTIGQHLGLVLVGSGLRYSEATALQVKQVDLLAPVCTLRVAQAWKRLPDSTYRLDEPKTPSLAPDGHRFRRGALPQPLIRMAI